MQAQIRLHETKRELVRDGGVKMEDTTDVKLSVTQVKDGTNYKGSVSFNDVSFDYKIHFVTPIDKLDDLAKGSITPEKMKKMIQIDITDSEGKPVSLETDLLYGLFLSTAGIGAIKFYNNPQTRDSNAGFMGPIIRNEGIIAGNIFDGAGRAEISIQSSFQIGSTPKLVDFLNQYRSDKEKAKEE